jgi:hypothetical protein
MWSSAMNTLLDPNQELSVSKSRVILDANLFFSSWGAFVIALMLVTQCYKHIFEVSGNHTLVWVAFATSSFISMSSAGRKWQDEDCGNREFAYSDYCQRSSFAVILGLVSGVVGVAMVLSTNRTVMQATSIALLAAWCVGVAKTTYNDGPGKDVSVLYFSTWTSLSLALHMASMAMRDFCASDRCKKITGNGDDSEEEVKPIEAVDKGEDKGSTDPSKKTKKVRHREDEEEEVKESEDDRLAKLSKEPSAYFDVEPAEEEELAV